MYFLKYFSNYCILQNLQILWLHTIRTYERYEVNTQDSSCTYTFTCYLIYLIVTHTSTSLCTPLINIILHNAFSSKITVNNSNFQHPRTLIPIRTSEEKRVDRSEIWVKYSTTEKQKFILQFFSRTVSKKLRERTSEECIKITYFHVY